MQTWSKRKRFWIIFAVIFIPLSIVMVVIPETREYQAKIAENDWSARVESEGKIVSGDVLDFPEANIRVLQYYCNGLTPDELAVWAARHQRSVDGMITFWDIYGDREQCLDSSVSLATMVDAVPLKRMMFSPSYEEYDRLCRLLDELKSASAKAAGFEPRLQKWTHGTVWEPAPPPDCKNVRPPIIIIMPQFTHLVT